MRAGDSYDRSLGLMVGSEFRRAAELANRTVTALSLFVPRCLCERIVTEASPSSEPPVSRALRTQAEDSFSRSQLEGNDRDARNALTRPFYFAGFHDNKP
jgi:hypothetical protein